MDINEPIDAVYTWIDGNDPAHNQTLNAELDSNSNTIESDAFVQYRFRDNGELRHSLRSLELYAPWIRHIYIVTNGQIPHWLDMDHPRIRLITHTDIFPQNIKLPCFNSNAIELRLHHIPELSNRYLYLNDDVFFGADTEIKHFIRKPHGQWLYAFDQPVHMDKENGTLHDKAYAYTYDLAVKQWGKPTASNIPAHCPQLYSKEIMRELENQFSPEFTRTIQNTFRNEKDIVFRILYFQYLRTQSDYSGAPQERVFSKHDHDFRFIRISKDDPRVINNLKKLLWQNPLFFCLNDEMSQVSMSHQNLSAVRALLANKFPAPSTFEKSPLSRSVSFQREMWNQRIHNNTSLTAVGSQAYGEAFNTWSYRMKRTVFLNAVKKLPISIDQCNVLDLGSGSGIYIDQWLALIASQVTAFDLSDASIELIKKKHPTLECIHGNICELPGKLKGRTFDLISAMDILFHIIDDQDYINALNGIAQLLPSGGYLIFTENMLSNQAKQYEYYFKSRTEKSIRVLLDECNLEIVSSKPYVYFLGSPIDSRFQHLPDIWDKTVKLSVRFRLSSILGALFYGLDRLTIPLSSRGISTKLIICQKR